MDFPIKNGWIFHSYVSLPEGTFFNHVCFLRFYRHGFGTATGPQEAEPVQIKALEGFKVRHGMLSVDGIRKQGPTIHVNVCSF